MAARAIAYAADHPNRREYWVGGSTAAPLLAKAIAPGVLDRYLARTGEKSQQTGEPHDPRRPDNLWAPLDGGDGHDYGAHGEFDDRSRRRSLQEWASHHHGLLAVAGGALTTAATAIPRMLRRR